MSQATIAISAKTHKMKFVLFGYSALQCSAKCFPGIYYHGLKSGQQECTVWENNKTLAYKDLPVTTPRFAARDWIRSAAHEATKIIQSNWNMENYNQRKKYQEKSTNY